MRRLHSRRRAPRNAAHESAVTSPAVGAQRQRNFQLPLSCVTAPRNGHPVRALKSYGGRGFCGDCAQTAPAPTKEIFR